MKPYKILREKTLKGKTLYVGWEKPVTFIIFQCISYYIFNHIKNSAWRKRPEKILFSFYLSPTTSQCLFKGLELQLHKIPAHLLLRDHPFEVLPLTLLSALENHSAATKLHHCNMATARLSSLSLLPCPG